MKNLGRFIAMSASTLVAHSAYAHGVELQSFAIGQHAGASFMVLGANYSTVRSTPPASPVMATMRDWALAAHPIEGQTAPYAVDACSAALPAPPTFLSRVALMRRASLSPTLASIACEEGVAPALLDALVAHESRYNPAARSGRGAIGLTQLMPGTVTSLGIANPWDIVQNLRAGARYLRRQLDAFGRYDLALAAYNAGPGQVTRHNGVPPFAETRAYVDNVLGMMLGSSTMSPAKVAMQLAYRSKHTGQPGPRAVLVQQFLADAPAP